jgi:hypothetical protein
VVSGMVLVPRIGASAGPRLGILKNTLRRADRFQILGGRVFVPLRLDKIEEIYEKSYFFFFLAFRDSERAIAIACLGLVTSGPFLLPL